MIEIDGAYGEGGGQILRMSVALSAVTGIPVQIFNIRAHRPDPGLKRQHMTAIESVARLCNARVDGLALGSTKVTFYPNNLQGGEYQFDIGTAGSVTLVLQACLLPSLFAKQNVHLKLRGGTDVKWAPPWDYFANVMLPLLRRMGVDVNSRLIRRGYYPIGEGEVEVNIKPSSTIEFPSFNETVEQVEGIVHSSQLPPHIAQRIKRAALQELCAQNFQGTIKIEEMRVASPGVGLVLWTREKILGANALGEKGLPAEEIGHVAAKSLAWDIIAKIDLDEHLVDQMLPYLALSRGGGSFTCRHVSNHAESEIWLLSQFLNVRFNVQTSNICHITVTKEE